MAAQRPLRAGPGMRAQAARRLPWRETGVWLMGDTHCHHRQTGLERVVDKASEYACDYLAFTEHSFYTEHLEAQPELIHEARASHPNVVLVNGVEWSTPAGDETRAEQVGLLVPGGAEGMPLLREFLGRFDTKVAGIDTSEEAFLDALRFLGQHGDGDLRPTVILTHPHRPQAAFTAQQIAAAIQLSPAVAGLCASSRPPERASELEVWPWASQVGGACDQLYAGGHRVVMLAESHVHKHLSEGGEELWPGEFRRNYIFCPERSEAGLFQGLRSGASYFVLGSIVEEVQFTASAGGESVMMGETLSVPPGGTVEVSLSFVENSPVEAVELIGNLGGEVRVVSEARGGDLARADGRTTWTAEVTMGSEPSYLRARGRAPVSQPYPVTSWFYTNPLWLLPEAR